MVRAWPIGVLITTLVVGAGAQSPPVVAIDEAHGNTHGSTTEFRGLVDLLQRDGYRVRPLAERITGAALSGINVLISSGPGGWTGGDASLTETEVTSLVQWIRDGGSLLLMLDHLPFPRHAAPLTAALGVTNWDNGYVMVTLPDASPIGPIVYWRSDALPKDAPAVGPTGPGGGRGYQGSDAVLVRHAITDGRSADERVQRVATFTGSAFQLPPGATGLLTLPAGAISLRPAVAPNVMPTFNAETPRVPVNGWVQGAVMTLGRGRVALFGETGMFSGGPAADNRKFILNLMRWLAGPA